MGPNVSSLSGKVPGYACGMSSVCWKKSVVKLLFLIAWIKFSPGLLIHTRKMTILPKVCVWVFIT